MDMTLKEFIKETLENINEGVRDFQKPGSLGNININPEVMSIEYKNTPVTMETS